VYNDDLRRLPEESAIVSNGWLFDGGCLCFARSFRSGHLLIDWARRIHAYNLRGLPAHCRNVFFSRRAEVSLRMKTGDGETA
jgi:hypothetical protein